MVSIKVKSYILAMIVQCQAVMRKSERFLGRISRGRCTLWVLFHRVHISGVGVGVGVRKQGFYAFVTY